MTTHNMKLITKYFDCIKNGTKRIELRLNDEKRKDIKKGDIIIFEELKENPRYLKTKVIDLYYEDNFNDLLDKYDIKLFADIGITKQELIYVLNEIYPINNQTKYGVVGIRIEII